MRGIHILFAVLFAISAGLQYNDPDPIGWALLYLAATALAASTYRGLAVRVPGLALAAVCLVWMVTLGPGMGAFVTRGDPSLLIATMQAGDPVIEEAREFLGLGIVLVYSLWAALRSRGAT